MAREAAFDAAHAGLLETVIEMGGLESLLPRWYRSFCRRRPIDWPLLHTGWPSTP